MPSAGEIRQQVAKEIDHRSRLAVPVFAGGLLYLLSSIVISATLNGAPTVGLLQGLTPALSGVANPAVSPRTAEVKYISHNALPLISGSVMAALAIAVLTLVMLVLLDATRFRRPATWAWARPLVLYGGIAFATVSLGHQIVAAISTHSFAVGHDHSTHAVDQALTKGPANLIVDYVDLIAGLALAAGMITTMLGALRVGLLPRWLGFLGVFTGLLIFLPIGGAQLQIVPAFWMVMMGILFIGRWPTEPPAWVSGEARPWPTAVERRAAQAGGSKAVPAAATAGSAPAPAPARAPSSRKRRKRGSRG